MPDGNMPLPLSFSSRYSAALADFRAKSRFDRKTKPLSSVVYLSRNAKLHAQNALLQSELERHRAKANNLQSILCSMEIAAICISSGLKLRFFTAAAGRLLDLGPESVGSTLSLCGPLRLHATLMDRSRAVLSSGTPEEQGLAMGSDQQLVCRLLPIHTFEASDPAMDGLIITFATAPASSSGLQAANPTENGRNASGGLDDHGLAAGYPDLGCGLTPRQHQVLGLVLAGHPSKNIAADLGISRRTVENHRAAIMVRTGATSLPALARLAIGADVGGDCKVVLSRSVS